MDPIRIEVRTEQASYPVAIGDRLAPRLPDVLREAGLSASPVVVSSPTVWRLHGPLFAGLLRREAPLLMKDGERAKTLATVARVYDAFAERQLDRSGIVIAIGGGVVGDVAGFAAATYLRGVRLVQVPTTLLSQVDSAVGGKVGVNLGAGKNLVGAFHQPSLVVCDPDLLVSLSRREFRAGLYEVVKYGVIASRPLFARVSASIDHLFAHDRSVLVPVVAECCRIKADVVGRDERESGPRRVLNFGHTIGHALEAVTKYRRFRHGEAIAYGMLAAARISAARGLMPADDEMALQDVIQRLGPLPPVADLGHAAVLEAVAHDKKVVGGQLHYVLAAGIGATEIVTDVTTAELKLGLKAIGLRR
jgi:3-dehydroquinate synthase